MPYQQQPVVPYVPPPREQNTAAMASLLCGLFAPLVLGLSALPAVILGHKARAEIQRTREQGEGAAMTGLILGWIWMALGFLIMLLIIS